ncbi:MAG: type II secretion system protein [Phycisphaerales bacterium]|nr:type II secretion system protein [Phycisphaerales bacterium]
MKNTTNNAFTLIEVLIVVVILGILSAVAIPKFATASEDAKSSAVQSVVAGVRSSIATYRTSAVIQGNSPYPTLSQLGDGSVLKFDLPTNPYSGVGSVQAVNQTQALARSVVNPTTAGWNYYVNNASTPPVAIFYSNNSDTTSVSNGSGGTKTANEL